jgi:pimeloyl-ACP methyl ester carboxylesterase
MRSLALCLALATVVAATADAGPVIRLGTGADSVWILPPSGAVRDVVVFGHGWTTGDLSVWSAWLTHLRRGGSLVVFPQYQSSQGDSPIAALTAYRQGIVTAFRHLGKLRVPVIAVGKSYGGSVVFDYAAEARAWRVPAPVAVMSIFPALPIGGLPSVPLRPSVYVEVLVGDHDTVAGSAGADAFWRWLAAHPANRKQYVVVRSHGQFVATHEAPQQTTPAAQAAFWHPLDVLLNRVK